MSRMFWLLAMLVMGASGPAHALSRIVVTSQDAATVTLDGVRQNTFNGRTVINPVAAGAHTLAVLSTDGVVLHQETLEVPDGVQVRVKWSKGGPFVVSGATASGVAERTNSHESDTAMGVKQTGAPGRAADGGTTSRGSLGSASGPRASDLLVPRSSSGSQPTTPGQFASRSLRSMTYGARAGTSFGGGGKTFNQTIKKPNVVYGSVNLIKRGGPACRVYDSGMLVAELDAGEASVAVRLEVGRRTLEFRDRATHVLWHSGDLKLDAQHTPQLVFDDTSQPAPQARPWLWQGL